jgi:DNA anti-recombination protein RmuC
MSTPEEEGRRSFMNKESVDSCPYDGQAEALWKRGYYKQEYDELKQEQANILETMGFYDSPFTGLEEHLRNVQSKIKQVNNDLSSSRGIS